MFAEEAGREVVAKKPWARIEKIEDGIWAIISTPLDARDFTTVANGGIIAGNDRVLMVESFASPKGAVWAAQQAKALTGKWPTDVVITHYHGDHANGLTGLSDADGGSRPKIWTTPTTRENLQPKNEGQDQGRGDEGKRIRMIETLDLLDEESSTEVDLGGRKVQIHPRTGHTASDLTVEIEDPSVVFYGDLLWNRMIPNYRDTKPSAFEASIRAALRERETVYVPGHGSLADAQDVERMLAVLSELEAAGRKSWDEEMSTSEAGRLFKLSESLGEWTMFSENYYEVAISAWHQELAHEKWQRQVKAAAEAEGSE